METIPGREWPHEAPETDNEPGEDVREAPLPGNAGGEEGIAPREVPSESGVGIEQAFLASR
jgi:hypothetical protein